MASVLLYIFPFNLVTAFDWSPDGSHIAFVHRTEPENWRLNDISTINMATGVITPLAHTAAAEITPFYSPDGQWMTYTASDPDPKSAIAFDIYLIPLAAGRPRALAPTPARRSAIIGWRRDGRSIYFTEYYGGETHIEALPLDGASPRKLSRTDGRIQGVAMNDVRTIIGYTAGQVFKVYVTPLDQWAPDPADQPNDNNLF